jgi:hypothetical protein
MHMRELRIAGIADQAKRRAGSHRIAGAQPHAAVFQMAILRFPPLPMIDDHAVAAFTPDDVGGVHRRFDQPVLDTVAYRLYQARRGRDDLDAPRRRLQRHHTEIRALMAVIGRVAAASRAPRGRDRHRHIAG